MNADTLHEVHKYYFTPRKKLKMKYSKKEKDFMITNPGDKSDGHLLVNKFMYGCVEDAKIMKSFLEELASRGYDVRTLKFSIKTY